MTAPVIEKLIYLCDTIPAKLRQFSEQQLLFKPAPDKWSKKELIGHLVDSAANNHQRFVRAQFETPVIYYEQDLWVSIQNYQKENTELLISLWEVYNRHLAHIIQNIPQENFPRTSIGKDGRHSTLEFIVHDYLSHLEYHLDQILDRDNFIPQ